MQITIHTVVTVDYTLKDEAGSVLDSTDGQEPMVYLHGTHSMIPGFEAALSGKSAGQSLDFEVKPEQAYGVRDERKVIEVPRDMFPDAAPIEVGAQYHSADDQGNPVMITVLAIAEAQVKIDANHPLAGKSLFFSVKVNDVRKATAEELAHGHVHGEGGHHH